MTEKEALILLNMVEGLGPRTLRTLKEEFPKVQDVFGAKAQGLEARLKIRKETARRILDSSRQINLKQELDFIEARKISVLSLWEPGYPLLLSQIYDPPPILYIQGTLSLNHPCVAMVGARSSTHYGRETAYHLSFQLASRGIQVVSGLARGIDSEAHRGALRADGRTVGVMGCGFRHFYPGENRALGNEIAQKGCLLSEFPSEIRPLGMNFPRRNRIISGLSLGVVVVEAARKSGSLITADFALEQGRAVLAVPGQVTTPSAMGTLGLLKDGAKLVQSVEDIFEELGLELAPAPQNQGSLEPVSVEGDEGSLLKVIGSDPVSVDEIARQIRLETARVLALLFSLELKHLVKQLPGKYYIRT